LLPQNGLALLAGHQGNTEGKVWNTFKAAGWRLSDQGSVDFHPELTRVAT
jgi:hypothetical protein